MTHLIAGMKLLFCAFGSVGFQPNPLPPGFENQFAVAVIEVNTEGAVVNAPAPEIALVDRAGQTVTTKQVVALPAGMIHLRVRAALATQSDPGNVSDRCRVNIGPAEIEGPVDGVWPT